MQEERTFQALLHHGSFAATARHLGVSRSTVLRRVESLEARLGVSLVSRTGKTLLPTPAGRSYSEGLGPILDAHRRLDQQVMELAQRPIGHLLVRVSNNTMGPIMVRALSDFRDSAPDVVLHVEVGNVDMRDEARFDVAVQVGLTLNPTLKARVLFHHVVCMVASPEYLRGAAMPLVPGDLEGHQEIELLDAGRRLPPLLADGTPIAPPRVAATVDSPQLGLELALRGAGILRVALAFASAEVEAGRLVRILPGLDIRLPVSLVHGQNVSLTTRHFVDFMAMWVTRHGLNEPASRTLG